MTSSVSYPASTTRFESAYRGYRSAALVLLAAFAALPTARALTWDTTSGNGATIDAGSGTWDTTGGNTVWNNGASNVAWTTATTAVFAGADASENSYAISVGGAVSATDVIFSNNGYSLTAASPQTVTSSFVTVASNKAATLGSSVTVSATNLDVITLRGGGTLNIQSGATVRSLSSNVLINGGTTVNVSGGALTANLQFVVGDQSGGNGQLNISNGTASLTQTGTGNIVIGNNSSGTNTSGIRITGGSLSNASTTGGLRFGSNGNTPTGTSSTLDVDGGTVTVARLYSGTSTNITSVANLNGGTLRVLTGTSSASTFLTGLTSANVKEGGAIIDTNNVATTIGQALLHGGLAATDGGLTKNGANSLTLTGVSTYTGPTTVNTGTLSVSGSGSIASTSRVIVAAGATFSKPSSVALSTAFTLTEGATVSGSGISATSVNVAGDLSNGFTTIASSFTQGGNLRFDLTNPTEGTYTIFSGSGGSFSGVSIGSTSLSGAGVFSGFVGGLGYTFTDATDTLVISAIPEPASSAALLGLAALGCFARRRRRT